LSEGILWDKAKGELRILGQCRTAVNIQGLCDHLDLMVGSNVAEVIMNQHEFRQGKDDAARVRQTRSGETIQEMLNFFADAETLSGVGVVKVTALDTAPGHVDLEISNPCVRRTSGATRSFLFSYWCGVFTELVGKEFKIDQVTYDENKDLMRYRIIAR